MINFIDRFDCRKANLVAANYQALNGLKSSANTKLDKTNANENNANQLINQTPETKYSNNKNLLNKYFLIYNLLSKSPSTKRSLLHSAYSANQFRKYTLINKLKEISEKENQLNEDHLNRSTFLNLIANWKQEQPNCDKLKSLWESSLNKLTDYFQNENNELFTQSYLNQMNNPIYLALLISLIKDRNDRLKILNFKPEPKSLNQLKELNNYKNSHLESVQNQNDILFNKKPKDELGKQLTMDYVMKMLNNNGKQQLADHSKSYDFKNYKFILNPLDRTDRTDHSLEVIEDGPAFVYNDNNGNNPSSFWNDAQLSKPVKPEILY